MQDMKKVKANISLMRLVNLKQQQKILLKEINAVPASSLPTIITAKHSKGKGKPPNVSFDRIDPSDAILIRDRSNSHTPPFLLIFYFFNKNVHNCLVDFGASSNVMPYAVCLKWNIAPHKFGLYIVQLNRTKVKNLGEMDYVLIRLSSNSMFVK